MEMRLVLSAIGLSPHVARSDNPQGDAVWLVLVEDDEVFAARSELAAYQIESSTEAGIASTSRGHREPVGGGVETAAAFVALMIAGAMMGWSSSIGEAVTRAGWVDAGLVSGGQVWRTVTALTLHADALHLASNLVFGTLMITLAARHLGGGVTSLLVVIAGAAGNAINASLHPPTHVSLGASTAVFAALGVGVALALRPAKRSASWMRRWSPMIAGAVLLAMTGTGGENTDVGAHFAGFFAGLIAGGLASWCPESMLRRRPVQWFAGGSAAVTIAFAWALALA